MHLFWSKHYFSSLILHTDNTGFGTHDSYSVPG